MRLRRLWSAGCFRRIRRPVFLRREPVVGGVCDLSVVVADVGEGGECFGALGHLDFAHLVGFVVGVFVFVASFGGECGGREVGVGVVGEFGGVSEPVRDAFEPPVFVVCAGDGFAVGVGDFGLLVGEVVFVCCVVSVAVFAFGEPVELVVGVGAGAGAVDHLRAVAVCVVFVFDGRGFPVGVADFGESVVGVVGVGGGAFLGIGQAREVPGAVVFLDRFAFERVDDFGDLLQHVALVFGGVFVAVGLADDLSGAVVFGFGDRSVGLFDFGRLVIRVVGVFRVVAVGVGHGFEVAVGVVGVFRVCPSGSVILTGGPGRRVRFWLCIWLLRHL